MAVVQPPQRDKKGLKEHLLREVLFFYAPVPGHKNYVKIPQLAAKPPDPAAAGGCGALPRREESIVKIVVIDGQSGRIGQLLVAQIKAAALPCQLLAVGTNAIATAAMVKAGADRAATGENAVTVTCRTADVIVGPIGILAADSLMGEITPAMAVAVGQSPAQKILLPVSHCSNTVVGTQPMSLSQLVEETVRLLHDMY